MSEHKPPRQHQKQSRINNTLHLWEFLLELLEDERYTSIISWTRKEAREFKIKRQEDVARKWGRLKQRTSMNYDKLSRALRYYYHKGIIKKVQGQRLVYKFDKLPYSYKPVRYNWPWNLPSEEQDVQPAKPDFATTAVSKAIRWSVVPVLKDPNSEEDVRPVKPDIGTPLATKETCWPVKPVLTVPKEEQNVKSVKHTKIPPLISMKTHLPVTPPWKASNGGQDVKLIKRNNIPPLISMKTHLPAMPTWKVPKEEQNAKTVDAIPSLHSMRMHLPAMPALSYGIQSPISSQNLPRNPDSELTSVGYPSRRPSQAMCRSQIIFPPCSCQMRSVVCGMRMLPDATGVPVHVITRFA